ncbi:MAG: hypothetical protein IT462_06975 [Planctomycetes bacterium]|nr:hypothetical protein [Planctomycetota bacterium]
MLLSAARAEAPKETYEEAKKNFDEKILWEPLRTRADALNRLAATKDERAVEVLRRQYFKPHATWPIQEKYLNAGCLENFLAGRLGALDINDWVEATGKFPDYWLEFNAYRVHAAQITGERLMPVARNKAGKALQRSAVVQALAIQGLAEAAVLIPELLDFRIQLYDSFEEDIMIAGCASALAYLSDVFAKERTDEIIVAAEAVINLLGDKRLNGKQRMLVVRHLAAFFKIDRSWMTPHPWLMLLHGQMAPDDREGNTSARPTFMGVEIRGKRPVFVLDLSDSMMIPLSEDEKNQIRKPVVTGDPKSKKKKDARKDPLDDLPWDKITNRFEAARECLKVCLKGLTKDMYFAVIKFGDKAEPMASTPRMQPVMPGTVEACIRELDSIKPGAPNKDRKHGTLMGQTNLHAGVVRAFRIMETGLITTEDEHINKECFETGTDSIIVLTDGAPTRDDYWAMGPEIDVPAQPASTHTYKDPETGESKTSYTPEREAYKTRPSVLGPFTQLDPYYRRDLMRMNLFRRCDIACIGVGEADAKWLNESAKIGHGRVRFIGAPKK